MINILDFFLEVERGYLHKSKLMFSILTYFFTDLFQQWKSDTMDITHPTLVPSSIAVIVCEFRRVG